MSQRNPMNDRYQSDIKGQTKKSAASAKPKSKAAASVYIKPSGHTPQEKKAIKKQQRAKQAELDRMFYNPPTEKYKKLKRIWWFCLIAAIALTVLGMLLPNMLPGETWVSWVCIIPAYAFIIAAVWLDFSKIRKVRREYQMEMMKKHPKQVKEHLVTNANNQRAAEKEAAREEKKKTRSGRFFGKKKEEEPKVSAEEAQKQAEEEAAKAKEREDASKPIAQLKAEREAAKKAEKEKAE